MACSFVFVQTVLIGGAVVLLLHAHRVSSALDCGTVNFVRPVILGGRDTVKGEWPFLAAIQKDSQYICGGTIISYRHILTAAHCIQNKNSEIELSSQEIVVCLGAYNLTNNNEKGVVYRNVSAILMHPEWDAFEKKFDADIAILVLSENITFTDNIQPICMPSIGIGEKMDGSVVGYGVRKMNTVFGEIPRRISVQTINSSHCFREDDVVRGFSSDRTFCGGNGDGSPDQGDSGSGYFFTRGFTWAQYGIVAALRTNGTGHVFPQAYQVYTNVTTFKDWIIKTVNETGGVVGEATISITMNCDYDYKAVTNNRMVYCCSWQDVDVEGKNIETGSFNGSHLNGKSESDVEGIHIVNGKMFYLPSGFGLLFENVKHLTIGELTPGFGTMGTKAVRRSDFRKLRKLEGLNFLRNDIETLNEDALWDLPNLYWFKLVENKLKILFNDTFSKNRNLLQVDFRSNQLQYLPANLFRNNPVIMMVDFQNNSLKSIDENIFKTQTRLRHLNLGYNQIEMLPKRLFLNKVTLVTVLANDNALSSMHEDLFETNEYLVELFFMSNRIESLPGKLFRNNLQLATVVFQNNSIATIDENLFENNRNLRNFLFADNKLERLPQKLFKSASSIYYVDLSNNRLKDVAIDFVELRHVGVIDLNGNDCISTRYVRLGVNSTTTDIGYLQEFRNLVIANCSTHL